MFARLRKMTVSPLMSALQDLLAVTLFLNALECRYAAHIWKLSKRGFQPCHRLVVCLARVVFLWDTVFPDIPFWLVEPFCSCFCFRPTIILWPACVKFGRNGSGEREREREREREEREGEGEGEGERESVLKYVKVLWHRLVCCLH